MNTNLLSAGISLPGGAPLAAGALDDEYMLALGDLRGLIGTWVGDRGKSLIAVPRSGTNPDTGHAFDLLQHDYQEEMRIEPVGLARNRGGDADQFVAALRYEQTIRVKGDRSSDPDKTVIHVENGMLLALRKVDATHGEPAHLGLAPMPFARSASIPHGNTILVYGDSTIVQSLPDISPIAFHPQDVGKQPMGYAEMEYKGIPALEKMLVEDFPADRKDPRTTTITFDSTRGTSVLTSVPYLQVRANTRRFRSTFWLIEGDKEHPNPGNVRLQYSQIIDLEFLRKFPDGSPSGVAQITWPHVTINSLTMKGIRP